MNGTRRSPATLLGLLSMAAGLLALAAPVYAAGLLDVRQLIFGMDCAPCAYGVEQGIRKLPGVTQVTVSLNDGTATVVLAPSAPTTLETIRGVIRDNGFTPKGAEVTLSGRLVRSGGGTWLAAPGLPRYRLTPANSATRAALQARQDDTEIEVRGEIPQAQGTASELTVTQIVE